MPRYYREANINILNKEFITPDGKKYSRTASIVFNTSSSIEPVRMDFAYIEKEAIYNLIDKGENINLDYCYIIDFSLSEYRSIKNLDKKEYLKLNDFSAKSAFFDAQKETDFSYAEFAGDEISFEGSIFSNRNVSFNSARFPNGLVSFANVGFGEGKVDFANVDFGGGDVSFKNAVFREGDIDFQYTEFGKGDVIFTNTEFGKGEVTFINTNFDDGDVSFKVSRFGDGRIDFHFTRFGNGDISFERTEFGNGRVDFRTVEFNKGRVNFNRCVFGDGEISFEGADLKDGKFSMKRSELGSGDFGFQLAEFGTSEVSFDGTHFSNGNVSFLEAKIKSLSLKACHINHYLDLRVSQCEYIDLSDVIARDIIDLSPYEYNIKIDLINFSGMKLLGRIYVDWKINKIKNLIQKQENTSYRNKAEQFRLLKENFNSNGHYNDEDKAYLEFKRYESKADLHEAIKEKPISKLWEYPIYGLKWLIFDKMGKYATDPVRVLISMAFGYLFFSILYIILPHITNTSIVSSLGDPDKLSSVKVAFYHSAVTFLTIGYGDYYPSGIIRGLSGVEGFAGLFLMSYFTVAFVRKILR
ncbi:MAG: two pore domain potassium channel family protein [Bacteroidales bacterium]|nr:two pore domain potassium channel family protein [Bacteroidales bacterium]